MFASYSWSSSSFSVLETLSLIFWTTSEGFRASLFIFVVGSTLYKAI